ncbi:hypothetical protein HAX54_052902 [Datura stramonium]|uniref:Uncharacterized protein n=1 Tax=Datura stramonium TaxID=4076 RepID=A0ABS8WNZ1_DATST|nr:hypothetical protein [Datura stramonium]
MMDGAQFMSRTASSLFLAYVLTPMISRFLTIYLRECLKIIGVLEIISVQEGDVGVHCNELEAGATTEPVIVETVAATQIAATEPSNSDLHEVGSDHSIENSSESDHLDLFNEDEAEYEIYIHEEYINSRSERRPYQRRKRRERAQMTLKKFLLNSTGTSNVVGPNDIAYSSNVVGPNDIVETAAIVVAPLKVKRRPKKSTSRGRPTKDSSTSESVDAPVRGKRRPTNDSSTSEAAEAFVRGRDRLKTTHAEGMRMPRRTSITSEWFENPTSYNAPAAAPSNTQNSHPQCTRIVSLKLNSLTASIAALHPISSSYFETQ